MLVKLIEERS